MDVCGDRCLVFNPIMVWRKERTYIMLNVFWSGVWSGVGLDIFAVVIFQGS